ncbi:MAG: ATP-dependent Clp protease ATP-binding subunit [Patescibacteria group bacterium]
MVSDKFYFNLKNAIIFRSVKWGFRSFFRFTPLLKKISLFLFIFIFPIFLYGFLTGYFSSSILSILLGWLMIFLSATILFWELELFFNSKVKKPNLKLKIKDALSQGGIINYNLADFLNYESSRDVWFSLKFARSRQLPEINSTILAYFILKNNLKLGFVFSRILLDLRKITGILKKEIENLSKDIFKEEYSLDFQKSILGAIKIASDRGREIVKTGDLISAIFEHNSLCKKILIENNLKTKEIEELTHWLEDLEDKISEHKRFWEWKNLLRKGSLAREWTAGFTVLLDQFSINVTELMRKQGFRDIFAHQREVEAMEAVLARVERNNVLIVGDSGSARRSMIEALANRCALGESLPELNYKKVMILDLPKVVAATGNTEEAEEVLDKILNEAVAAGNVILVIDDIYNYISVPTERRVGAVEVSGTLSSYLALPSFQFIGITTFDGLHTNIEQNSGLLSLFEKIEVSEISEQETLFIIQDRALRSERKYKIIVSYPAVQDIISLSARYLTSLPFPEKAMQLLDEAMVNAARKRKRIVLPEDIAQLITQKTQIPVGELESKEKEILLDLENLIHQRIINQEEAVGEISSALRRARADITIRKGPMGAFLFLGPTGVGKTETSKALAEIYFGSEEKMIRLDMSEFQELKDIARLIGSRGEKGMLTTSIRENPFSLILLDEFEKSHPDILNLFLQVFDEGHLTDGQGRKVDFKNAIIIATSNAGYQIILQVLKEITQGGPLSLDEKPVGKSKEVWDVVKKRLLTYIFDKGIFRPELINRFDGTIVFTPLSRENLLDIAELMLQKLKKNLKEKEIEFIITLPLKEKIADLGYDPIFGARAMRRVIQDRVENILASTLLEGKIKRGDKVEVDSQTFELKINA